MKVNTFAFRPIISMTRILPTLCLLYCCHPAFSQSFSHADTLRGSITKQRSWWDVMHYHLRIQPDLKLKRLKGSNTIVFRTTASDSILQIDLQQPLHIDSVLYHHRACHFIPEGNAWFIKLARIQEKVTDSVTVYYSGIPQEATRPPWNGGVVWKKDSLGRPFIAVACQHLGASVWWPLKDHQSDEPDLGVRTEIRVPDSLVCISNGRLLTQIMHDDHTTTWVHEVLNPINSYDVTCYIGNYVLLDDTLDGKSGTLRLQYAVLDYNKERALAHLQEETHSMLHCFEYWFGPYPFYQDGYRLVETNFLGMEHQSAIAYGNNFQKGYRGTDRSGTGIGLFWDFILIHETGHEWFGNNITTKDIADMWVHEAFTTYSEALFIECNKSKEHGSRYIEGLRKQCENKQTIITHYDVNEEGPADMYDKGANLIHMIRQIIDNDSVFPNMLLEMNRRYAHQTVSGAEIEAFINTYSGKNFTPLFDQYLRAANIPVLEYRLQGRFLYYRWVKAVKNFDMPLRITLPYGKVKWLHPTLQWQEIKMTKHQLKKWQVDTNFYIETMQSP